MFRNLLVPLDGSPMAESALGAAAYLAPKLGADVTLIHCVERAAPETVHGERHLREPQEARAYLEEAAARAFPPAAGAQARAKIACHTHAPEVADVASSILEHANEMPSTLIVMRTHGRSGVGNLLFGNIAQRIIGGGTTPVLLMPPRAPSAKEGEHKFSCRRLLVPLDGNPAHEQALTVASDLAAACQSEMHLVFVVPTRRSLPGSDAAVGLLLPHASRAVLEIARKEAQAYLSRHVQCQLARQEDGLARLGEEAPGRSVTSEVCRGDAAKAISRAAQRARADLIVMATHRREAMDAFWSGSVAPRVASDAKRPILLVPIAESAPLF
jgi:nucleotide-binding universal stress UspA family protein